MDAITLAYSSLGLQCPIGVRAHSTRGIASSWAWSREVAISEICEAAGWSSPSTFVRFYNLESFLLKLAILWVHLTNIVQALPSLDLSILYGHQVLTLRDDTQATDDPDGSACAWCILLTPLGLTPTWVLDWVVPPHSMAWLYWFP